MSYVEFGDNCRVPMLTKGKKTADAWSVNLITKQVIGPRQKFWVHALVPECCKGPMIFEPSEEFTEKHQLETECVCMEPDDGIITISGTNFNFESVTIPATTEMGTIEPMPETSANKLEEDQPQKDPEKVEEVQTVSATLTQPSILIEEDVFERLNLSNADLNDQDKGKLTKLLE